MSKSIRIFALPLGLVAACSAWSNQDAKTVSMEFRVGSVSKLISDLGAATGQNLKSSAALDRDYIFASFKNQSVEDVMARLAKAVTGRWKQESDGLRLVRDEVGDRKVWEDELAIRTEAIKERIATIRAEQSADKQSPAELAKQAASGIGDRVFGSGSPPSQAEMDKMRKAMDLRPGPRAVIEALTHINPTDLAKINLGDRAVFAYHPTRSQSPLAAAVLEVAKSMVAAEREYQNTMREEMQATMGGGPGMRVMMGGPGGGGPIGEGQPGDAMLIVHRNSVTGLNCILVVNNTEGQPLVQGSMNLFVEGGTQPPATFKVDSKDQIKVDAANRRLATALAAVSPSGTGGQAFTAVVLGGPMGGGRGGRGGRGGAFFAGSPVSKPVIDDSVKDMIMDPVKVEPLSTYVSDVLVGVANTIDKPIIGIVPDRLAEVFLDNATSSSPLVSDAINELQTTARMTVAEDSGWVHLNSKSPVIDYANRIDRAALKKLMSRLNTNPVVSLDDRADYAATVLPRGANTFFFDRAYASIMNPSGWGFEFPASQQEDLDTLRLFGRLSRSQRDTLRNGGQIGIGSLTSPQRQALNILVFGSQNGPEFDQPESAQPQPDGPPRMRFPGLNTATIANERTTVLTNGIPAGATIVSNVEREAAMLGKTEDGTQTTVGVRQYAFSQQMASAAIGRGFQQPTYTGYKAATRLNISLRIALAPRYGMDRDLADTIYDNASAFGPISSLPMETQNALSEALSEAESVRERMESLERPGAGEGGGRRGGGRGGARPGQNNP